MEDELVLVDENDNCIGTLPKQKAHEDGGVLHRAFSIFIFDSAQRMLLQLRGKDKYHFGGRWTNACCSHPRRGEELQEAAHRRLREELGFDVPLQELFSFTYRAYDEKSGLTEHEFDHVFIGHYDGVPQPNPQEVDDWKWVSIAELENDLTQHPDQYTAWFRLSVTRVCNSLQSSLQAQ
jgi:isopentenyl-diphosphate delta-isomerase